MQWIDSVLDWAQANDALLWWSFAVSLALLILSPLAVAWVVMKLPTDYFTTKQRRRARWPKKYPALWPVIAIAKNLLGIVLLLAGLVMLVVPGQGLLTIIVGLMLIDFPGKMRLLHRLAKRAPVWRTMNWLRRRAGKPPLKQS